MSIPAPREITIREFDIDDDPRQTPAPDAPAPGADGDRDEQDADEDNPAEVEHNLQDARVMPHELFGHAVPFYPGRRW